MALDDLSDSRRKILITVKEQSAASITDIARALGVTHEAARKQVLELQRSGLVTSTCPDEETAASAGRPAAQYCLTRAAENLFPKNYAALTVRLVDRFGPDALAGITDDVVRRLRARAAGPSLPDRLAAAREVYVEDDPYTSIERRGDDYVMIEKNCPYVDVAIERPAICSTTVSALRRFTGREVVRERRFQDGDGRCEFHVRAAIRGGKARFEIEPPRSDSKP